MESMKDGVGGVVELEVVGMELVQRPRVDMVLRI